MSIWSVIKTMRMLGADRVLLKRLSANDNSKNQVYIGGSEAALRELRVNLDSAVLATRAYRVDQPIRWMTEQGETSPAPDAKVIFYPQYPEARLSGFARGVPPGFGGRDLLIPRSYGRTLLVGLTNDGWLMWVGTPTDAEIGRLPQRELRGTPFYEVPLDNESPADIWSELLGKIAALSSGPVLPSVRLASDGRVTKIPPTNPHAGGYALEAALDIPANATPGPDYRSLVELKAFSGSRISLMTPEPTSGVYADGGIIGKRSFMHRWGLQGSDGKYRFNGQHRLNEPKTSNPLTMRVRGWTEDTPGRYSVDACLTLVDAAGTIAAGWLLKDMNASWLKKHDQALYVQYRREATGFRLTGRVYRCHVTDFRLFMLGLRAGSVIFDPGHSMDPVTESVSSRSQWRTSRGLLLGLYDEVQDLDLLS